MSRPVLPESVVVLAGTDVDAEWERFEVFEALHHRMQICNPMTDADLNELVALIDPADGARALDVACGHGELLLTMATVAAIDGVGIDLSPWVVCRANAATVSRPLRGTVEWWLGNARELPADAGFDIVTCLGASWIWHGFEGTARALLARVRAGGTVAIGDLRLLDGVDSAAVARDHGTVQTCDEQAATLSGLGYEVIARIEPGPAGWDRYEAQIEVSAQAWLEANPGPTAAGYVREQEQWRLDHERDRALLAWTVWVLRAPGG